MKREIKILSLSLLAMSATAEYRISIPLERTQGGALPAGAISITTDWNDSTTVYGDWIDVGYPYGCENWSPLESTITIGKTFTQTATDCSQDQTRTAQDREIESISGIIRNKGTPYNETRVLVASDSRDSIGILETWLNIDPTFSPWINNGDIYDCKTWNPAPSTITIGQYFIQTSLDCKQDQTRSRQDREQETTTKVVRNKGQAVSENQTITVSSTRNSTGSKETWVEITPIYSAWSNTGAVYNCSAWTPNPSTVNSGSSFTQNRSCSQNQENNRQNREQETTTKAIRNTTTSTGYQTITVSQSQSAVGTKPLAIIPTINSLSASATYSRAQCLWSGTGSWSGSNVANYTIRWPDGSAAKGTATSHTTRYMSNVDKVAGTWTLTACSSTGDCVSRSVTASKGTKGKCM